MTITLRHPPIIGGDDDPEWKMTFSLSALMGDHRLYECSVSFPECHFEDERRDAVDIPFSVRLSQWLAWEIVMEKSKLDSWQVVRQPVAGTQYYDHTHLLAIDKGMN